MIRFIRSIFRIFLGVWKQRNAILHDDSISGAKAEATAQTLQRIYAFPHYYLSSDDLFLLESIPRDHLDHLSPYAASQWLSTLTIAVKARHKDATLQRLSQDPSYNIERYFTTPRPGPSFAVPRLRDG